MRLLYFAWLRERAGTAEETVDAIAGVGTVAQLIEHLRVSDERYLSVFEDLKTVRVAVNQEYVGMDHAIAANDEIAFFPPVTGG